jgi:hypothetical protein
MDENISPSSISKSPDNTYALIEVVPELLT